MGRLAGIKKDRAAEVQHRRHANVHRVLADQHEDMAQAYPRHAVHHRAVARLHRQIAEHHEAMTK